jgi:hypothetical protein
MELKFLCPFYNSLLSSKHFFMIMLLVNLLVSYMPNSVECSLFPSSHLATFFCSMNQCPLCAALYMSVWTAVHTGSTHIIEIVATLASYRIIYKLDVLEKLFLLLWNAVRIYLFMKYKGSIAATFQSWFLTRSFTEVFSSFVSLPLSFCFVIPYQQQTKQRKYRKCYRNQESYT